MGGIFCLAPGNGQRGIELPMRFGQGLFFLLARGDVFGYAHDADELAFGVAHRKAACIEPAELSVCADQPVFHLRLLLGYTAAEQPGDPFAIFQMNQREPCPRVFIDQLPWLPSDLFMAPG